MEEIIRVRAKPYSRAESMRVKRERKFDVKQRAAEEEAAWMEAKIQYGSMNPPSGTVSDGFQ